MIFPSADPKTNRWNPISNHDQRNKGSNQPLPTTANHHIITTNLLIINYLYIIGKFEKLCLVGRLDGWSHFPTSVNFKTHFYFPLSPFWGVRGKTEDRHLTMATLQINTCTIWCVNLFHSDMPWQCQNGLSSSGSSSGSTWRSKSMPMNCWSTP